MLKLYFFLLGTILASFAGLAAFRLGTGQSPWSPGRSYCDHCQQRLAPWQLIPICGYLLQGGRCRYCQTPLTIFYPLSELLTGGAALILCHTFSPYSAGTLLVLTSLVFLASTDHFYQFIYPADRAFPVRTSFSGDLPWRLVAGTGIVCYFAALCPPLPLTWLGRLRVPHRPPLGPGLVPNCSGPAHRLSPDHHR